MIKDFFLIYCLSLVVFSQVLLAEPILIEAKVPLDRIEKELEKKISFPIMKNGGHIVCKELLFMTVTCDHEVTVKKSGKIEIEGSGTNLTISIPFNAKAWGRINSIPKVNVHGNLNTIISGKIKLSVNKNNEIDASLIALNSKKAILFLKNIPIPIDVKKAIDEGLKKEISKLKKDINRAVKKASSKIPKNTTLSKIYIKDNKLVSLLEM